MLKIALTEHHLDNYHADTFAALLHDSAVSSDSVQIVSAWESNPTGDDYDRPDHRFFSSRKGPLSRASA